MRSRRWSKTQIPFGNDKTNTFEGGKPKTFGDEKTKISWEMTKKVMPGEKKLRRRRKRLRLRRDRS
jgi:hypothetical protein